MMIDHCVQFLNVFHCFIKDYKFVSIEISVACQTRESAQTSTAFADSTCLPNIKVLLKEPINGKSSTTGLLLCSGDSS